MSGLRFGWRHRDRRVLIGFPDGEVLESQPLEHGRGARGEIEPILNFIVEQGMVTRDVMNRVTEEARRAFESQGVPWDDYAAVPWPDRS